MKSLYKNQINEIVNLDSDVAQCNFYFSLLRSITQTVSIICLDYFVSNYEDNERVINFISSIKKPSDGHPQEILDYLVPLIRNDIDNFMDGWFEKRNSEKPLSDELKSYVEFRNNTTGHGVLDKAKAQKWSTKLNKLAERMLNVFDQVIPNKDNQTRLDSFIPSIPLTYEDAPYVIRSIVSKKGLLKLKGQTLSIDNSKEFTIDISSSLLFQLQSVEIDRGYATVEVNNKNQDVFVHNIPIRQTELFQGRIRELTDLQEWYNDEDSRTCLIYGDGGYGKTTLILESLHQILSGDIVIQQNTPLIICFYSAKIHKWTEEGLKYFDCSNPVIDDCIRQIIKSQTTLTKDWYTTNGHALINKAKTFLQKEKIERNDILLIIDNTETLANNTTDIKDLTNTIMKISKSIARVIVTSRRREAIEARPIIIEGLQEIESLELIKQLSQQYEVTALRQAGERRLRHVAKKLMHKPILIETYVKYMKHSKISIDDGLTKFYSKSKDELLEFLYEDAWNRMNELPKYVFLVTIYLDFEITKTVLEKICQQVEINITEFLTVSQETHFADIYDYDLSYTFEIVELAKRFFHKKIAEYQEQDKNNIQNIAKKASEYNKKILQLENEFKNDRVYEAYRSEFAKQARVFSENNKITEAIDMYQLAIEDDPLNSFLHERYAWLLLNRTDGNLDQALTLVQRAYELNKNNVDAIVNLGIAHYKLQNLAEVYKSTDIRKLECFKQGDSFIDLSVTKGRSKAFGSFRKGMARYQTANRMNGSEKNRIELYSHAMKYFELASKLVEDEDPIGYEKKVKEDSIRYYNNAQEKWNRLRLNK